MLRQRKPEVRAPPAGRARSQRRGESVAEEATPPPSQLDQIRACLRFQTWPWWVCFIACLYCLAKTHLSFESSCAILGTPSPVSRSDISRAYRAVTICTHPDRLMGESEDMRRRGLLLFNRATKARDRLQEQHKATVTFLEEQGREEEARNVTLPCDSMDGERLLFAGLLEIFGELSQTPASEYLAMLRGFALYVVRFEGGFTPTISIFFLLLFFFRVLSSLVRHLTKAPPLVLFVGFATSTVLGALPTISRFFFLPALRLVSFVHSARDLIAVEILGEQTAGAAAPGAAAPPHHAMGTGPVGGQRATSALPRNVRKKADERKATGDEAATAAAAVDKREYTLSPLPVGAWDLVRLRGPGGGVTSARARSFAADNVQFDALLAITKPIFPLMTLLATGTVYNGAADARPGRIPKPSKPAPLVGEFTVPTHRRNLFRVYHHQHAPEGAAVAPRGVAPLLRALRRPAFRAWHHGLCHALAFHWGCARARVAVVGKGRGGRGPDRACRRDVHIHLAHGQRPELRGVLRRGPRPAPRPRRVPLRL